MEKAENSTTEAMSSISSEETVASKPWLETVRLGQKIVHELGLDHTNNLLSRWMAHRVAELMEQADAAPSEPERESARRECADLILRLWERRMEWPHGAPLSHILPTLREITAEPPHRSGWGWQQPKSDGTWAGLLHPLDCLQSREVHVCLAAVFADVSKEAAEHSRQWLQEHPNELSDEEQEILQTYLKWVDIVGSDDFSLDGQKIPNFSSLQPHERTAHTQEALRCVSEERQKMFDMTQSHDEVMRTLKPNRMVGNIAKDEEEHAEHFALLHEQIQIIYGDDTDQESDGIDTDEEE